MYSMSKKRNKSLAQLEKATAQSFALWVHSWVWADERKVEYCVIHEESFVLFHSSELNQSSQVRSSVSGSIKQLAQGRQVQIPP